LVWAGCSDSPCPRPATASQPSEADSPPGIPASAPRFRCGVPTGLTSRNGTLRTIAALHNQVNQALPTPATLHIDRRNGVVSDAREINGLSELGVRDAPNLEAIPLWLQTLSEARARARHEASSAAWSLGTRAER
jgi:hypothetical protein